VSRAGDVLEAIDLDRPRRPRDPGRRRRRRTSIGVILVLALAAAVSVPVVVRDATGQPDREHAPTRRPGEQPDDDRTVNLGSHWSDDSCSPYVTSSDS
jgi:hypothetical protein